MKDRNSLNNAIYKPEHTFWGIKTCVNNKPQTYYRTSLIRFNSAGCEKLHSLCLLRATRLLQSSLQRTRRPRSRRDLVESPKRIQMKTTTTNLHWRTVYKRLIVFVCSTKRFSCLFFCILKTC